jgi:hypothetical protein
MKAYWSDTRPNGEPIAAGTFCRVIDLEDGTNPIFVYGKTQDEVFEKIERQNAHAQIAMNQRKAAPIVPAAPARVFTPDQVMQATADLNNPAKAGQAIATLIEHTTGMDPVAAARDAYARLAMKWESENPDFYQHKGNRQIVGNRAIAMAGNKPGAVTRQMLDTAFAQTKAEGLLFEKPASQPHDPNNPALTTSIPAGDPGSSSERPRGTRFSTGANSRSFSAPQTATTGALKYTEDQIRTMSEKERRRVFDDPDYIKACDFYYLQGVRATA